MHASSGLALSLQSRAPAPVNDTLSGPSARDEHILREAVRQSMATSNYVFTNQCILLAAVVLLTLRKLALTRRRRVQTTSSAQRYSQVDLEEKSAITSETSKAAVLDRWFLTPVTSRWWFGLANRLQVAIFLLVFGVNTAFILPINTDPGEMSADWNEIHVVALRCGYLSLAHLPIVFALQGRNSLVAWLTGIEYQDLRFGHKLFAAWSILLGLIHTVDASTAALVWTGRKGVYNVYLSQLGLTGAVILAGFASIAIFAIRRIRMMQYELFLFFHILGAILVLVGLRYHVPALATWVYVPVGFWVHERVSRALKKNPPSFKSPSPLAVRAHASLVNGAILLRVPSRKHWGAGQHAYISIMDPSFMSTPLIFVQQHPFSIGNLPCLSGAQPMDTPAEMVFIIKVRDGLTKTVAEKLESSGGDTDLWVRVEGPYGTPVDTTEYQDVVLIAGGSGITHCASVLASTLASLGRSETRRVTLVWTVPNADNFDWMLQQLLVYGESASKVGILLSIQLFHTRGNAKSRPSELHPRSFLSISQGRPPLATMVSDFLMSASGNSLVVACGPAAMAELVRAEATMLMATRIDIASFEC